MSVNDIINRHKKHLTKAQVHSLVKLSNEYKQLNAGRRAEAYEDLYTNHQDFRRGLQNMGLASRRGNIISGREVMGQVRVEDAYHRFNDQLNVVEDRMLDNAAERMRPRYVPVQQKKVLPPLPPKTAATNVKNREDNIAWQWNTNEKRLQLTTETQYNPLENAKPQGSRFTVPSSQYDKKPAAPANQRAEQMEMRKRGYMNPVAENAQMYHERQANPEHYKALDNQLIAQQIAYQQNLPKWDAAIAKGEKYTKAVNDGDIRAEKLHGKEVAEAEKAREDKAKALSDINRAYTASTLPKNVGELVMLNDDDFAVRYDAAQKAAEKAQKAYSEYKDGAATFRTDSEWVKEHTDALKSGNIKQAIEDDYKRTQTVLALFEQAKQSRNDTAQMEFYADEFAIPESKKVKQKDYASVTDFVRSNQTNPREEELSGRRGNRLGWASITDDTGRNWKEAEERGWKATDYENRTKTNAKYDALVNEWSIINGNTLDRYTMEGKLTETFAGVAPRLSGRDKSGYMYYDKFRNQCTDAFYGYGASSAEHEQMETMLTLANLMTDEERAKYNAIHNQAGANKADEYFEFLYKNVLPQRFDACLAERNGIYTNTWLDKMVASGVSVPMNLAEGATGAIHQTVTGQSDPTAAKLGAARYNTAQATRDTLSKDFSDGTFGGKWWYGAAMSAADSTAVALVSAGLGKLFAAAGVPTEAMIGGKTVNVAEKMGALAGGSLLGGAAYNAEYNDALARGLAPDKARIQASGVAFNEMLFESLSVDMILNQFKHGGALKIAKNNVANWLINTGAQGVVEMSEEDFTSLANKWFDEKLNGIMSKELTTMRGYMNDGMSFEEAKKRVSEEFADELFSEGMAGFVTGAGMGGAASGLGMIHNRDNAKFGHELRKNTRVMDELKGFDYKSETAQDILTQSKLTDEDVSDLFNIRQQELLEQNIDNIKEAVNNGTITQEDADLLNRYKENGVQIVKDGKVTENENGITAEEYSRVQEILPQLQNGAEIQFLNNEEMREMVNAVGGEVAAAVDTQQTQVQQADRTYQEAVNTINADTTLTDEQKNARIAEAKTARAQAVSTANKQFDTTFKSGRIEVSNGSVKVSKGSGSVTFDYGSRNTLDSMTANEASALRIAKVVASRGVNVKMESEFTGMMKDGTKRNTLNGYYDKETNTIHVNLSGNNSVLWTVSHELTHYLAAQNTQAYEDLRSAIESKLKEQNLTASELNLSYDMDRVVKYINKTENLYDALVEYEKARGYDSDAEEEVIARCCESFLANRIFVQSFAKKNYKSAKAISEFLTQMNTDMRRVFDDAMLRATEKGIYNDMSPEQEILAQVADIDDIARLWSNAVNKVGKRLEQKAAKEDSIRKSLNDVEPVQPTSNLWKRTIDTAEAKRRFPTLWDVTADESEVRNPTQIKTTVSTYRKIYDMLKAEEFNGTILDASSGLGYGTKAGQEEYGFKVDDIEPYPDASYKPKYTDYSTLNKKYDVIISNAVLNVIPQDQRDALVVKMGEMLKDGGRIFINTRAKDVDTLASNKRNTKIGNMEWFVADTGSYQKGFTPSELQAYVQDALGDGFTVERSNKFGAAAVVVTKKAMDEERASTMDDVKLSDKAYTDLAQKYKDGTATDADKSELRKAVDAAAKEAGYTVHAYHGTPNGTFTVFRGWQYFTESKAYADVYQGRGASSNGYKQTATNPKTYEVYLKPNNAFDTRKARDRRIFEREFYQKWGNGAPLSDRILPDWTDGDDLVDFFDEKGYKYDAIYLDEGGTGGYGEAVNDRGMSIVIKSPSQIKSADLVTYDNDGNIIPLSERFNEKEEDIRRSIMDKDFRMTKRGNVRTFEQNGTTANVIGSSVDLEGGSLLNRVRMMQNLAEEYGSVTVTATSEKEAKAFERAGAQRETDAFSKAEFGTWEFTHTENKYEKDTVYDAKQKRNFADAVLKEVGTRKNFTQDELRVFKAKLEKAFAVLHNATFGKGDQLAAWEYADKLFDSILNRYSEMSEADADMRDAILAEMPRKTDGKGRLYHEIEVTEGQMAEIKYAFGSVAAYNQALSKALGTRVYVKQTENAKTLEDVFASDSRFDATTNEGDMPGVLLNMAQETIAKRTNPLRAESQERAAAKEAMFAKAIGIVGVEQTTAQKVREAVKEARAEERAKAKDKTAKAVSEARLAERMHEGAIRAQERRASAEREANIKRTAANREAKLKEITQQKMEQQKTEQLRRDMRKVALKWNQRLVKMLANPTEASHVPVQLAKEVAALTKAVTEYIDKGTERGRINLDKVIKAYQRAFDDQATIAEAQRENPNYDPRGQVIDKEMYDEQLVSMMNELNDIIAEKSFDKLSAQEMYQFLNVIRGAAYTVYNANRMIGTDERKSILKVGDKMVTELEEAPKVNGNLLKGYLSTSLDLRRIALIFNGSNENAEMVKLVKQLNDGAIEKERVAQVLKGMFDPLTEQYGDEIRTWYGKKAEWIDTGIVKNGRKVEITKGMRVSLALHVLNEGNMRHIENGGLTIPDKELYAKGKLSDAYANKAGRMVVQLNADEINAIIAQMTDAEKAYVEVAKEFFHKRTGYYVNKTSLQLLGYRKAVVDNYFPIHTNDNYTQTDFASVVRDGSIEGQGFLKERVVSGNPIYLEDITSVVNRQIKGVSLYAGLAVPMRNFKSVMNAQVWHEQDGVWKRRTSVKETMTDVMGDYGTKVVQGFLQDVSGMSAVDVQPAEKVVAQLQTRYVKAVLLANLKVTLKQAASYPTAAAVIPWKYLRKALVKGGKNQRLISRADVDLINQYTPLYQMRREGMANEITTIMAEKGLEQKMPWLLGWITKMDVATVGRLWSAAEYMVADTQKNLPVGSDAYYKAVAEIFNKTVQQTQPNFTPLQRNAALRSKNPVVRTLTLFGTQRMQNGGLLIEAFAELKNSKDKGIEAQKAARKKVGRVVASQLIQNAMLCGIGLLVDALRGRMKSWQDDDKDVTVESISKYMGDQFLGNMFGSFLGGSEAWDAASTLYKRATGGDAYDTEFTVPALDALESIIGFMNKDSVEFVKYMTGDHTSDEKLSRFKSWSFKLAKAGGYATGLPIENLAKTFVKGWIPALQDIADATKTGELIPWLHQSGKLDSAKTARNYKEWVSAGKKGSTYLYWENQYKSIQDDSDQPNGKTLSGRLMTSVDLSANEKATLYRMLYGNDTTSEGAIVYNAVTDSQIRDAKENGDPIPTHGTIAVDFSSNASYIATSNLSDTQYEGYKLMVADGVPEDMAYVAYRQYSVQKNEGAGANERFHDWLFNMESDPHQRAVIDMYVIGNTNSVKGSIGYKDGNVWRDYSTPEWYALSESLSSGSKQYTYAKKLVGAGLSDEKAIQLIKQMKDVKKADSDKYLKGLTEAQKKLIYEYKGWKYGK